MLSERQNEIIQTTIEIIANKGIQGFTLKNLSVEIGISEPAIYRHFKSKTDILFTMLKQFQNFKKQISENILSSKTNSLEKINMVFESLLNKFSENSSLVSVIFADEIFYNEIKLSNKIAEIRDMNNSLFVEIIGNGQQNNEIRKDIEVKYVVLMIMGALRLLVKKWKMSGYNFDLQEEGKALFLAIKTTIQN